MEVYGIRITHTDLYDDIQGCLALEEIREAIKERIGMQSVFGTQASHSLEDTFFFVKDRCLAEEALDAIRTRGIPVEYIPMGLHDETGGYQGMKTIAPGNLDVIGVPLKFIPE